MGIICFHNPDDEYGFLSNWDLSDFEVDGIKFTSLEQYMMYKKAEVDEIIQWLTGYEMGAVDQEMTYAEFLDKAPAYNPGAERITGSVCGVKVETIDDPLMKKIRQLDKLIDELAKGRPMEKILR